MKKRWQISLHLLLYIFLLTLVMKFEVKRLIDIKGFFVLLAGSLLLTLPFYRRGMKMNEISYIFGRKSVEAGLIQTFLMLFIRLSDGKGGQELLPDIALCFRSMLYAFCIRTTFSQREADVNSGNSFMAPGRPENISDMEITYDDCIAAGLTKREAEIALWICKGCSNGQIAEELVISETTVKKHVSNIFEKTGVRRREELRGYITENKNRK